MKKFCRRLPTVLVTVLLAGILPTPSFGQTLTETLLQEEPATLIRDARQQGDIVRGAILFHQGNLNCAQCHRPTAEKDRIGPDLSRIAKDASDASIVESILLPSRTIKKGYETVFVLTADDQILYGIPINENDLRITLITGSSSDQPTMIERDDIVTLRPGKKSNMPDGLANELKDRRQFLDLLRYVLELKDRGPSSIAAPKTSARGQKLSLELRGLALINQLNCTACHQPNSAESKLPAKLAPDLKWSATRLNPGYLTEFVANPHRTQPGTSMPQMLGHLDESSRRQAAEAIVHYLVSMGGNRFGMDMRDGRDSTALQHGFEVFHSVGCVACHSPRNELAEEQPLPDSMALGNLAAKYDLRALTEFLEDPHAARPSGRMPNMQLSHREAIDLAVYLLQTGDNGQPQLNPSWQVDPNLARVGKRLFSESNCIRCHTGIVEAAAHQTSPFAPLDSVESAQGCLSGSRGAWPDFQLSSQDHQAIRAALQSSSRKLTDKQQIDLTLVSFNCIACHRRDHLGGVSPERRRYFQTTNMNLGEQGRIPPTLTGVGAKLKAKWTRDVLVNHRSIRPYMKTRMPQYGEANIGHLVDLFQETDRAASIDSAAFEDQKEMRKLGLEIAGNRGLNCVACHTYQYKLSDTMPAVDLTEMAERLKKDWFYQYMLAPQQFSPNTVMPSFWPSGQAIRPDILGEPEFQIEALWQYLLDGRQAAAPRGVLREPLEIVVGDEARMLRRRFPGIGKRGIGVGYPGGINLAFDAEQMRLAMIWKGKFVDPSGVWYGQGHGAVRALGRSLSFPNGPELDSLVQPWIVDDGRPPKHQFHGYALDESRRPTFRYRFESVMVEDYCTELIDPSKQSNGLHRTIKMTSTKRSEPLRFRVAADENIVFNPSGSYSIGDRLKIHVSSIHASSVQRDGNSIYVVLDFEAGQIHELEIDYFWE